MTSRRTTTEEPRTIRTALVLDPGDDQAALADAITAHWRQAHGLELQARVHDAFAAAEVGEPELLIFDWGALSLGNDFFGHQVRALCRWAAERPYALMLIVSALGPAWIREEVEAALNGDQTPANVMCARSRHGDPPPWPWRSVNATQPPEGGPRQ